MANPADLLAQVVSGAEQDYTAPAIPLSVPEEKRNEVAQAAELKLASMAPPTPAPQETQAPINFRNAAIGWRTGSGVQSANPVERDLATLSPDELRLKYGNERANSMLAGLIQEVDRYAAERSAPRTGENVASDAVSGAASALVTSFANIGALGLSGADRVLGTGMGPWASRQIADANEWVQGTQSPALQTRRWANQERAALDARDATQAEQERIASGQSSIMSGFQRIGRDILDSARNISEDPALAGDVVTSGVGSLLAAGPLSKLLGWAGNAAVPASIALLESSGSYQQVANELSRMSEAELQKVSPAYVQYREQNMSHEDARNLIANNAGQLAAAATAPAALAAGHLVSRFEGAPFRVGSVRGAAANMGREGVEEATQGATGQLAQNLAVRATDADTTRNINEGIGEQIVTGALGGIGAAGVTQSPAVSARIIEGASRATLRGLGTALNVADNTLVRSADNLRAQNESASPVSDTEIAGAATMASGALPQTEQIIRDEINTARVNPEVRTQATSYIDNLLNMFRVTPEELANPAIPENVRTSLQGSRDKIDIAQRLSDILTGADTSSQWDDQTRLWVANQVHALAQDFETRAMGDTAAFDAIDKDSDAFRLLSQYAGLLTQTRQTPGFQKAMKIASKEISDAATNNTLPEVTPENISTPEGQQAAQIQATAATIAPDKANLAQVDQILEHVKNGKLVLPMAQRNRLRAVQKLLTAAKKLNDRRMKSGMSSYNLVSAQVAIDPSDQETGKISAFEWANRVSDAVTAGNNRLAKAYLKEFGKFAEHMANKVAALNKSFANADGKAVPYKALHSKERAWYTDKIGVTVHRNSEKSIQFANQVALEAQWLATVFNNVSQAFPELEVGQRTMPQLDEALFGNPAEVLKSLQAVTKKPEPALAPKPTPKPQAESKPVAKSEAPTRENTVALSDSVSETGAEPQTTPVVANETPVSDTQETLSVTDETQTEDAPESVPEEGTIEAAYPNLTVGIGHQIFRLPKEMTSRIQGIGTPISKVIEAFRSSSAWNAFTGKNVSQDNNFLKAYRDYLGSADNLKKDLEKRLEQYLNKEVKGQSRKDYILSGAPVYRWRQAKILSLLDSKDGDLGYNQELLESAVLAGLQWLITMKANQTPMTADAVSALTGLTIESDDDPLVATLNKQGVPLVSAVSSLSAKIREYWGLSFARDAKMGYTVGVPEAMAKEILTVLINSEDLVRTDVSLTELINSNEDIEENRTLTFFNPSEDVSKLANEILVENASLLDKTVLTKPPQLFYFNDERPEISKTQLRNPLVPHTPEDMDALKNASNTPFFLNEPMVTLYEALTVDGLITAIGAGSLEGRAMNEKDKESKEGVNLNIREGIGTLLRMKAEAFAASAGKSLSEIPIFFGHAMSRVGRMQQLGAYTPQSHKGIREGLLPTGATLDLSDPNSEDYSKYLLAVGQMLGVKVHKNLPLVARQQTLEKLQKLEPLLDMLRQFHQSDDQTISENFPEMFRNMLGSDRSFMALHALTDYARLQLAKDRKSFTTQLYVEADGVTNGVVNAMSMLTPGGFTPEWLARMAKGGLFFMGYLGGPNTMNELHGNKVDTKDLYQETVDKLKTELAALRARLDNPRVQNQMRALVEMMNLFLPGFEVIEQKDGQYDIKIDRSVTKNPLTITLYGSGAKGIAGNVLDLIMEQIYEKMSDLAQAREAKNVSVAEGLFGNDPEGERKLNTFLKSWDILTSQVVLRRTDGSYIMGTPAPTSNTRMGPVKFAISRPQYQNFQTNLLHLFIGPMREAIEQTVGSEVLASASLIQQATQIQSLFQVNAFQQAIRDRLISILSKDPDLGLTAAQITDALDADKVGEKALAEFMDQHGVTRSQVAVVRQIERSIKKNKPSATLADFKKPVFQASLDQAELTDKNITDILAATGLEKQALEAYLAEKGLSQAQLNAVRSVRSEGLSRNDLDKIMKDVLKKYPLISTGHQNFFVAGSQSAEIDGTTEYSRTLDDKLGTPAMIPGPKDAGVAGIPFMVIGPGDGRAVQDLAGQPNAPKDALYIFDGINFALDNLNENSVKANKSIFTSWQGNPLQAVGKMLRASIRNMDVLNLPIDIQVKIARTFNTKEFTPEILNQEIRDLLARLESNALEVQAMNEVRTEVQHTIDQMASASAPYIHEGEKLQGSTHEQIALQLNERYQTKLAGLKKKNPTIKAPEAKPTEQEVETTLVGEEHPTGVRIFTPGSVMNFVSKMGIPPYLAQVLSQLKVAPLVQSYSIIRGSGEQLRAYADNLGIQTPNSDGNVQGWISIGTKKIFMVNPTKETLVHELIHAASFETVKAVLEGNSPNQEAEVAVGRLMTLMDQFLALDTDGLPLETRRAMEDAKQTIMRHMDAGNTAAAINEFMAWGLANKDIAKVLDKTKANPIVKIVLGALAAIQKLLFSNSYMPIPGKDMFSNLLFNSAIIFQSQPSLQEQTPDTTLLMARSRMTNDERLKAIQNNFNAKVIHYINKNPADSLLNKSKADVANLSSSRLAHAVSSAFPMSAQALYTFKAIALALATEAYIDPASMTEVQTLYAHVIKNVTVESFMVDPTGNDPNDRAQADLKYKTLLGQGAFQRDAQGRSSILPIFLALSMVDDGFRNVMSKVPMPKTNIQTWNSMDNALENLGNKGMDLLTEHFSGVLKNHNIRDAMDSLASRIQDLNQDKKTLIEQVSVPGGTVLDKTNQVVVNGMQALADKAVGTAEAIDNKHKNKITGLFASSARLFQAAVDENSADKIAEGWISALNKINGWQPFRELVTDLVGRTETNKGVYDLIKLFRSDVQKDRQEYRETLPAKIAASFSKALTDEQWKSLHIVMARTDLAGLFAGRSMNDVLEFLIDPTKVDAEITRLENEIQQEDTAHWTLVQSKSKQLAHYMMTGEMGTNLLRNAEAVSNLLNEATQKKRKTPSRDYVQKVDELTSLYALKENTQANLDAVKDLVQTERPGVTYALAYLIGQRTDEMYRVDQHTRAKFNHVKGHIPELNQEGASLIVADDSRFSELREKSYVRVGDYKGSAAEFGNGSMGYYYAPVSARAAFNQGTMQNVIQTASGVEASTGFLLGSVAGRITEPQEVAAVTRLLKRENTLNKENLLPVFNDNGVVIAYERGIDPAQLNRLSPDTHLARAIGVWRGRQVEEGKAGELNRILINRLYEMYQAEQTNSGSAKDNGYINVLDQRTWPKDDPVLRDALKLMSRQNWRYAQSKFGNGEFWVRRDMLNDVFGYRTATIGDAWTGNTRWSPQTQRIVKNLALSIMGNDAYRILLNREQDLQQLVKDARTLIVVKSLIVPTANMVGNLYHLISRGVPVAYMLKNIPKKLVEVNTYTKNRIREIELEADLRVAEATNNTLGVRKAKIELQSIKDANQRLTIWPLIEAGEFNSISDAGISREDLMLSDGRWHAYIERQVKKLPQAVQNAGRYAFITKDTALFQGLQKSVEYGDFLAKAIMYDDLTIRQKKPKAYAFGRITEEFVNYDRLPGRFRGTLENLGLLWFYNFKIRSTKIALSMIRNNPLHALLANTLPTPPGMEAVGTALSDNLIAKGFEGTLGWSIGPGMGFRAPTLNPWNNLVF